MSFTKLAAFSVTTALVASPALAITPEEVWAGWQEFLTNSYGAELEIGNEAVSGETLTITDLTLTTEAPDGSFEAVLESLTFENIGDGRVRITLPDRIPMAMAIAIEDGATGMATMAMTQAGNQMTASGSADSPRYDFDFPSVALSELEMTGTDMPDETLPLTFNMTMDGLTGFVGFGSGGMESYQTESNLDTLSLVMEFSDPEGQGGGTGRFDLTISDLAQVATGSIGSLSPGASLSELIQSGTSQDGRATHGPAIYTFAMDGPEGSFEMAAAAESGELSATLGPDGLSYATTTNNVTATIGGSSIPLPPLSLAIEETGGLFTIPIVPGDDPQNFQMVMKILGMTADETLWSLFDPGQQLPRDPANLIVDLSGSGVVTMDFTDPEFGQNPEEMAPPGELSALTINELLFSIAGAELKGIGNFAFSNDSGMPTPSGNATISLTGGNKLIDTLVGMGLIPEEQAMGARMMLGLFARPVGEDELVSDIEVTEDGQILANGQRIR